MKNKFVSLLILLPIGVMLQFSPIFAADKIVVIVNASNTQQLNAQDIKNIYTDNVTTWRNGSRIKSFDLPAKSPTRKAFSANIIGMSAKESARMWANKKITNSAKNPPITKKERLVVSLVGKNPNAIGYVSKSMAESKKGVRIVFAVD